MHAIEFVFIYSLFTWFLKITLNHFLHDFIKNKSMHFINQLSSNRTPLKNPGSASGKWVFLAYLFTAILKEHYQFMTFRQVFSMANWFTLKESVKINDDLVVSKRNQHRNLTPWCHCICPHNSYQQWKVSLENIAPGM